MLAKTLSRTAACLLAFITISAFQYQPLSPLYNPEHYINSDPAWVVLADAAVTTQAKQGVYTATFPADLRALENKPFTISGFMMPLEPTPMTGHFVLIRRNSACPFCPPNSPTEAVEIMSNVKVKYTGEEISVTGRLKLVGSSADGLFFRLESATVKES